MTKLSFDNRLRAVLRGLTDSGSFKINQFGKLTPVNPSGVLNGPWVFMSQDARRKFCGIWNGVFCQKFGIIPRFCRFNCWKTVIYPRNVLETLRLEDGLRMLGLPSKVGEDRREYTFSAWGGYVYGDSLEQGREYWKKVREMVDYVLSPDVRVILKRGCTEMERIKPSDTWDEWTEREKALEIAVEDFFYLEERYAVQSEFIRRYVREGWILKAISIGDESVEKALEEFGNGKRLEDFIVKAKTYHEGEEGNPITPEEIKFGPGKVIDVGKTGKVWKESALAGQEKVAEVARED